MTLLRTHSLASFLDYEKRHKRQTDYTMRLIDRYIAIRSRAVCLACGGRLAPGGELLHLTYGPDLTSFLDRGGKR